MVRSLYTREDLGREIEAPSGYYQPTEEAWLAFQGRHRAELVENEGMTADSRERMRRLLQESSTFRRALVEGVGVCLDGPDNQRTLVVPLISRGLPLGALCLASSRPGFGCDPDMTMLAGAIASQIVVAFENARRFEEAQFLAECDSMSPSWPSPATMWSRISSMRLVPSLQGTHLPHDSSCVKSMKKRATSTMHESSSMTIMPPLPIIEPAAVSDS
jgi:hypothetical protein